MLNIDQILDACRAGDDKFIESAIKNGDELFVRDYDTGMTPLHIAAAHDARRVVVLLVNSGQIPLDTADYLGRTPVTLAYHVARNPALGRYLIRKEYAARRGRQGASASSARANRL